MSTYVKGSAVANATRYDLLEKVGENQYNLLVGDAAEINFEVSALGLSEGDHVLVVVAQADGYADSDYSNEVVYTALGASSGDEGDAGKDTEYIFMDASAVYYHALQLNTQDTQVYKSVTFPPAEGYVNTAGTTIAQETQTPLRFACTILFTPETLPVGSVIEIASGWQFRPERMLSSGYPSARGNNTTNSLTITDSFWDGYAYVGFNISKTDSTNLTDAERTSILNHEVLKITFA